MPSPHRPAVVDHSSEAAHIWYREVAHELETEDLLYAGRVLRTVLHALRDRLPIAEGAQLSAQLPTLIRGIFYEGWQPAAARHPARAVDAFLGEIAADGRLAGPTEASLAVAAVAHVLHGHVSAGEMQDVLAVLPQPLRPLFAP